MLTIHPQELSPQPIRKSRRVAFVASFAIHAVLVLSLILLTSDVRLDPAVNKPGEGMPGQSARSPAASPQTLMRVEPGACASGYDAHLVALTDSLRRMVSSADSGARVLLQLPAVDSSHVWPVESDSLCRVAARTINRIDHRPDDAARTLYVLRVGNVYFVVDTNRRDGVTPRRRSCRLPSPWWRTAPVAHTSR